MNAPDLDTIIRIIQQLSIKDALAFLVSKKIFDISSEKFSSIKRIIQEKIACKKYGFIPNKDEGNFLIKVAKKQYYQEFEKLLSKHKYSDLIRTGYLIAYLNKVGGNKNRQRVKEIREFVYQKPNGYELMKIVNLVTTGAIVPIIDYLSELKNKNYDKDYLTESFDEIIWNWKRYAYFVKAEQSQEQIIKQVSEKLRNKQKLIMVFSYGSAKNVTTKSIAQILISEKNLLNDYFYYSKNNKEGEKDVHTSTFVLI